MSGEVLCIILNWRTPKMTLEAARTALTAMNGIEGAITIVDNDSQDGSFEYLSRETEHWPRVRVLSSGKNGGYGAGNNYGMRAGLPDGSKPEFYYILNSDAFPAPDAIRVLRDFLLSNPSVGFAGSYIHGEDGEPHQTAFRFPSILSEFEGAARTGPISKLLKRWIVARDLPDAPAEVDWLAGASVMMRATPLDWIGLFDEEFFLYFEETDLFKRAAVAAWPTYYVNDSKVMHIGSVSTGMKAWERVPDYWFQSRRHYFEKNHGRPYQIAATLAHLAGAGIYGLRVLARQREPYWSPHFFRDLIRHSFKRS